MRAATLFSGIGAPEQARPDWQWLWHAEIEPFPAAVLAARHPGSVNLGDVSADDFAERAERVGRPDILVFGSPCQSFSVAGKRLGLSDPRGNLALVALALVGRLRPRWFVFENVPGLLSSDGGRDFQAFLGAVAECGYFGSWRVLDARYWGLAQRRERVFFVGSLGDWRGPAAVLSLAEGLHGYPEKSREAGPGSTVGTLGGTSPGGGWRVGADEAAAGQLVAHTLRADGFDASEDGTGRGTPLVPVAFNWQAAGDCRGLELREHTGALQRQQIPAVLQPLQSNQDNGITERTLSETADADAVEVDTGKILSVLRDAIGEEAFSEWSIGVLASFREAKVLLGTMLRELAPQRAVKRELVLGTHDGEEPNLRRTVRALWEAGRARRASSQWRLSRQQARELGAYLSELPQQGAPPARLLHDLRRAGERSRLLQQALDTLEETRRSDGVQGASQEDVLGLRRAGSQQGSVRQALHAGQAATQVRRLSVIECARLQGFPDTYAHIITKRWRKIGAEEARYLASHGLPVEERAGRWYTPVPADGPMYKAYGNSMAVPVLRWLLTRIEAHDAALRIAA